MGDKVTFGHYRVLQRDDGSLWELRKQCNGDHLQGTGYGPAASGCLEGNQLGLRG